MVKETKPLPKVNAVQAQARDPRRTSCSMSACACSIRAFRRRSPNDLEELAKKRIYPDMRHAEARSPGDDLRDTLEGSGQWGAVRVVPANAEFVDVIVSGKILEVHRQGPRARSDRARLHRPRLDRRPSSTNRPLTSART